MAKKTEQEEEGAPLWMVTMSDMNTLLMTFFVILFSMMTQDQRLYMHLEGYFKEMSNWANPVEPGPNERSPNLSLRNEGEMRGNTEESASRQEIPRPPHKDFRITRRPGRLVVHLSDDEYGFPMGEYRLSEKQKEVLDWVKETMRGYRHNVVVHGFTDGPGGPGEAPDAYVLDAAGPGGAVLRPARPDDANPDFFLLSSLRAQETRRYLTAGGDAIDKRQVRVGEYALRGPPMKMIAHEHNRRVEVVISSRMGQASR